MWPANLIVKTILFSIRWQRRGLKFLIREPLELYFDGILNMYNAGNLKKSMSSTNGKISRLGTRCDYCSHTLKRGLEGRLRHHRGGLVTCTITNWTPAVVPHKIRTKKLMGSDL